MARIFISAGHTMMDPGAIFQDLREGDLTRKIAPLVIPYLQAAGQEVVAVPLDLPLWQRLDWIANEGGAEENGDLLIEVHINDSDGTKRGIEVWYKGTGVNESQKLAHAVSAVINKRCGYQIQGVRSEKEHELGQLTFLSRAKPTPILLEALYLDNAEDIVELKDDTKLQKLAEAIAAGILAYRGVDLAGQPLAEAEKIDFSGLQAYQAPAGAGEFDMFGGMDDLDGMDDLGDLGLGDFNDPVMGANLGTPNPMAAFSPVAPMPSGLPSTTPTMPPSPVPAAVPGFPAMPKPAMPNFGGMPGGNTSANMMMDRKQREEMVDELYVKFLGRKPTQQDLNHFVNQGVNRQTLMEKIADSQEHQDLIKAKRELEEVKNKLSDLEMNHKRLTHKVQDQDQLMGQLNQSIAYKNQSIQRLEQEVTRISGKPANSALQEEELKGPRAKILLDRQRRFTDKIYKYFSKRWNK
jgi:N-acetylmuramoyl-L-alanine amidase